MESQVLKRSDWGPRTLQSSCNIAQGIYRSIVIEMFDISEIISDSTYMKS